MHPDPNDSQLILGPNVGTAFGVYDIYEESLRKIHGHMETPYATFWIDDAKRALTSNQENETIIWNTSDWSMILRIKEPCSPIFYPHYDCAGIFIDDHVKIWSEELCRSLKK